MIPDCLDGVLGTHGLCNHGRTAGGDDPDAGLSPRPLRDVVRLAGEESRRSARGPRGSKGTLSGGLTRGGSDDGRSATAAAGRALPFLIRMAATAVLDRACRNGHQGPGGWHRDCRRRSMAQPCAPAARRTDRQAGQGGGRVSAVPRSEPVRRRVRRPDRAQSRHALEARHCGVSQPAFRPTAPPGLHDLCKPAAGDVAAWR